MTRAIMCVVGQNEIKVKMVLTSVDSQFPLFLTLIITIMNKPRFKRFYKKHYFILTYHTVQFTWYYGTAFNFSWDFFK